MFTGVRILSRVTVRSDSCPIKRIMASVQRTTLCGISYDGKRSSRTSCPFTAAVSRLMEQSFPPNGNTSMLCFKMLERESCSDSFELNFSGFIRSSNEFVQFIVLLFRSFLL